MDKYIIEQVQIEGFKGFTSQKQLDLKGKHVFLFGDNGNGKSSALEAIRWCLCGGEKEETLRNDFYEGDCQVELFLRRSDTVYRVHRRLRPGSGKSDVAVFTPDGKEHGLSDIFPALPRLFSEEGIYIVLAEQSPSWRRPATDISEFGRVIYAYLGWDELRELLNRLAKMVTEYEEVSRRLASDIEKVELAGREGLEGVQEDLSRLLSNPPWQGNPPTYIDTQQKIQDLVDQLTQQSGAPAVTFASPQMMLTHAESLMGEIQKKKGQPLKEPINKLQQDIGKIVPLYAQWERARAKWVQVNKEVEDIEEELTRVCEGETLERLEEKWRNFEREVTTQAFREDLLQKALRLLDQEGRKCPICSQECLDLEARIHGSLEEVTEEQKTRLTQRDEAKARQDKAQLLSERKSESITDKDSAKKEVDRLAMQLSELLALVDVTPETVEEGLRKMRKDLTNLQDKIGNLNQWVQAQREEIERFRQELRFHALRADEEKLEAWLLQGLKKAQDAYQSFGQVLDSVNEVRAKIRYVLQQELGTVLPQLSDHMSEVYQRLTNQKSYDRIKLIAIQEEEGKTAGAPKIEVKVYSSRFPGIFFDPTTRLNGQALRALYLVPYFVFSGAKAEISGIDLLILDDPSQRFDTTRLSALLGELKDVASHSQLIVATHERDRFGNLLPSAFSPEEYIIINVKGFDPTEGPIFEPLTV